MNEEEPLVEPGEAGLPSEPDRPVVARLAERMGQAAIHPELDGAAAGGRLPLPTWRLVVMLALPVLAQQGLYFLVGLSDMYLAGHLPGDLPLEHREAIFSARTTAHYVTWFITCYNVLVTVGSTALVARFVGAGDRRLAVAVTHQSLLLAAVMAAVGTTFAFAGGLDLLVDTLELKGLAADFAVAYLQPMFALLFFQIVEAAGIACLVGAGDTRTGLGVMVGVAIVNIPLAWGLSRGWGPLPQLGFVGIAVGTALSHTLGGSFVLWRLARGRYGLRLHLALFRPRLDLLARLLRVSVPAGLDSLSVVAGQLWFLKIVNGLGTQAGAAHGIALVWEAMGYLSGAAFGTAATTLVGQNLGAGRPGQAARAGWMAFALGSCVMALMGLTFYVLAPQMFGVFCPKASDAPIIALGVPVLRLVAYAMPALASTIVFTYALRGAGDTRVPVLFTWTGFFLVRIPLAYLLTRDSISLGWLGTLPGFDLGLLGAWWAMFADLLVRGVFFFLRFARGAWKGQKV
jgi:putative MATE family efflux protein